MSNIIKDSAIFELTRTFGKKLNILIIFTLIAVMGCSVFVGIKTYSDFETEKKSFLNYEEKLFKRYVHYLQYGDNGFRVIFEPSPISIFFNQYVVYENLQSNIDMSEVITINSEAKGKKILRRRVKVADLSGIIFILGSL